MGWNIRDTNVDLDRLTADLIGGTGAVEEDIASEAFDDSADDDPKPRKRRRLGESPPPDIWF